MKRWEAERAAIEEGKKIRRIEWSDKHKFAYYWNGSYYQLEELDGWEIYEEPKPKKQIKRFRVIWIDTSGNHHEEIVLLRMEETFDGGKFATKIVRVDEETIEVDE